VKMSRKTNSDEIKFFLEIVNMFHIVIIIIIIICNYKSILIYLHLQILYSKRSHLDDLLLINFFKSKIDCCSIMERPIVDLRVLSKQIREFPNF
jgi:hypothetical protein